VADNISRPVSLSVWLREPVPTSSWQARAQQLWLSWRALRSNPSVMFGAAVILAVTVIAIFAPLFATHDIFAQDLSIRLQKPSAAH
jgi:peptide/nickel transport system permease protein